MNNDAHIYKIEHWKRVAALNGGCGLCPPHLKENETHRKRKARKSWKFRTRKLGQFDKF